MKMEKMYITHSDCMKMVQENYIKQGFLNDNLYILKMEQR